MDLKLKNKLKVISLVILSSVLFSACTSQNSEQYLNMSQDISPTINPTITPAVTDIPISSASSTKNTSESLVTITTKDGQIVLKLYSKEAPHTVDNFIKKADSGFYKGLTFHRVIADFMAQGGDPLGNGTGGGSIASEINNIPFVRGTIGLARGENKAISNDSQFFICFSTVGCQHLTGDYVNFGEVVSGLDVLDKIQQGDKIIDITTKTK